jgi:segregation and condensation protein A
VTERVTTEPAIPDVSSAWEDLSRRPPAGAASLAPILSVDGFEGPLDWLLEMARAQKIDLARLSIAALIDSFATALETALAHRGVVAVPLARWGDWLVMAANLTWLRSRLLLPADAPEAKAAADEAEALRRQLVRRAEVNAATDWLERQPQLDRDVFGRGRGERAAPGRVGDVTELLRACLAALQVPDEQAAAYRPRPPPLWRVTDAIARIEALIDTLPAGSSLGAFLPVISDAEPGRALRCRAAVASTLIAGLELARGGALTLDQATTGSDIQVRRLAGLRSDHHEVADRPA